MKIDSLSASLLASKTGLEKFKVAIAQQKSLHEGESNKQDERAMQIVQSVSKLQVKMKISPTLEEQLLQPASASAVTPLVAMRPLLQSPLSPYRRQRPYRLVLTRSLVRRCRY